MQNYGLFTPTPDGDEIRIKNFRSAQNRVAIPMFIMLFIEFAASTLMIVLTAVFPRMSTDLFKSELMQALLYLSYMGIPVFTFGIISGKRPSKYFSFKRGRKHTVAVGIAAMGVVYFAQLVALIVSQLLASTGAAVDAGSLKASSDPAVIALRFV